MKNKLFIILALFCTLSLHGQGQSKVAVYIAGDTEIGTRRIFGTKLVEAFNQSGGFSAVDHTADFLAQARRELGFSNLTIIDDDQFGKLGKYFGAQLVCVAELLRVADANHIAVRLINTENDEIVSIAGGISKLNGMDELGKTAASIVNQLLFPEKNTKQVKDKGVADLLTGGFAGVFIKKQKKEREAKESNETKESIPQVTDGQIKIDMVYVKEGSFTMGAAKDIKDGEKNEKTKHQVKLSDFYSSNKDGEKDEKPEHQVQLSDFYISKTEVTNAQWKSVMGSHPSKKIEDDDQLPACVSWIETQEFIAKLNVKTGVNYRLPSEAEWEYAARGGSLSKNYKYSGSNNVDEVAWYKDLSGGKAHAVGGRQANELGIYDMSGNVWEWCSDRYEKYSASPQYNPVITDSGKDRVARGGSYSDKREDVRVLRRMQKNPDKRSDDIGFRLVSSQKPE